MNPVEPPNSPRKRIKLDSNACVGSSCGTTQEKSTAQGVADFEEKNPVVEGSQGSESNELSTLEDRIGKETLETRWDVVNNTFTKLFDGVDGYATAREVRKQLRNEGKYAETETLQYGEVDPVAFCKLLTKIPLRTGNDLTFLDIGSGTGKPVLAAASIPEIFSTCAGIEIVKDLHDAALQSHQRLLKSIDDINIPMIKDVQIHLHCADSFKYLEELSDKATKDSNSFPGISDVDVLFAPTTCFTKELMLKLEKLVSQCTAGTIVITTTQKLSSKEARLLFQQRTKYGRGSLNFLVYRISSKPLEE